MRKILFPPVKADAQFLALSKNLSTADPQIKSHFLFLVQNKQSSRQYSITLDGLINKVKNFSDQFDIYKIVN